MVALIVIQLYIFVKIHGIVHLKTGELICKLYRNKTDFKKPVHGPLHIPHFLALSQPKKLRYKEMTYSAKKWLDVKSV